MLLSETDRTSQHKVNEDMIHKTTNRANKQMKQVKVQHITHCISAFSTSDLEKGKTILFMKVSVNTEYLE